MSYNDWLVNHKRGQIAEHKQGIHWHEVCIEKLEKEIERIDKEQR